MNDASTPTRKRGPKPSGVKKVVFYARVTPEVYVKLRAIVDGEDKALGGSLGRAASDIKDEDFKGIDPRDVSLGGGLENSVPPKPQSTLKPRPPLVLPKEVAEQVRPNYFKK
jgi:hypothetical protein